MPNFKISFLDHVALSVKDIEVSTKWYEDILGLKKYQLKEWGAFPVFLLAGKSGIALFPLKEEKGTGQNYLTKKVDHFAFNISRDTFEKAMQEFEQKGVEYDFQDHFYFHSIYLKDPDDYTVELTTIVVDEEVFYDEKPE